MQNIELRQIAGGALQEQFEKAFESVVENLQNPNTPYRNIREITIKLKFAQNERRDDVRCAVLVTEKLAPQTPTETAFVIGKNLKTGEVFAKEYGQQIIGQMQLDLPETEAGTMVDTETGEVIPDQPEHPATVVDLRKVR